MPLQKKTIKISIIVPFYNVSKYLRQCLDSIAEQSFEDFEVIMINDGSTDESEDIASLYLKDHRFKLITTERVGISKCRNIGLENSSGEYISFIDSDDFVDKDFLQVLINRIEDCDLIICDYYDFYEDYGEGYHHRAIERDFFPQKGDLYNHSKIAHEACVVPWNKLYKKEVFNGIHYVESVVHEDEEIIQRILNNSKKIKVIKDRLYYYRKKRFGSIMHSETNKSLIMGLNAIESRLNSYLFQYSSLEGINETIKTLYFYLLTNFNIESFIDTEEYHSLKTLLLDIEKKKINKTSKVIITQILNNCLQLSTKRIRNRLALEDLKIFIKNNSLFKAISILMNRSDTLNIYCDSSCPKKCFNIDSYYFYKKYKKHKTIKEINIFSKTHFESVLYDSLFFFKDAKINLVFIKNHELNWYQKQLVNCLKPNDRINIIFQ